MSALRRWSGSLSRPGSPATRRALLFGGLGVLAVMNYLDLVGVLGLAWTNNSVGWMATAWTAAVALTLDPREELSACLKGFGSLLVAVFGMIAVAVVSNPDVGMTYLFHSTTIGQLAYAAAPAAGNGALVLFLVWIFVRGLSWFSEYRYLRRTTPEERVLGEESR